MYSVLPIAMIGKSLNHRLSIYQRSYNFAPNFNKQYDYELFNDYMVHHCGSAVVRVYLPCRRL